MTALFIGSRTPAPARAGTHARSTVAIALAAVLAACAADPWTPPAVSSTESAQLGPARDLAQRAQLAEADDRPAEAEALYREAIATYRDFPAAWNNLGILLMKQKKYLEAAEALGVASDLSPGDPRPVTNVGLIWEECGYPDEAAHHYDEALRRDPGHLPALRRSIYLDATRAAYTGQTAERIREAIARETDPQWRDWLQRQKIVCDNALGTPPGPGRAPSTVERPPSGADPMRPPAEGR